MANLLKLIGSALEVVSGILQQRIARSCRRIIQASSGQQAAPETTNADLGRFTVSHQKNPYQTVFSRSINTIWHAISKASDGNLACEHGFLELDQSIDCIKPQSVSHAT
jgi:hypothetical protein